MTNKDNTPEVEETVAAETETETENDIVEETVETEEVTIESLQATLQKAQAEADKQRDIALRTVAEMENLKKRQNRELQNAHKFALEGFVNDLLGVRDTLELGLNAAHDENASLEKLTEGSELTLKMLADVMEKFGVKKVESEGQPFDPDFHQAISMIPNKEVKPNTVLQVVQAGYTLNERLVRPAMVIVSQN